MTETIDIQKLTGLNGNYLARWDQFVGQQKVVRRLRLACANAKEVNAPLPHILLACGMPGVGKTTLAVLCAIEIGKGVKVISGKVRPAELRLILSDMHDGDILIHDEFHMQFVGGKAQGEHYLNFMQDGILMTPLGAEEQPKVTIIACTTDRGKIPETVRSRFKIAPDFAEYSDDEATEIALTMASSLFGGPLPIPSVTNLATIAEAAQHNSRTMYRLLLVLRDLVVAEGLEKFWDDENETYDITEALDLEGITPDGLDGTMQRYLVALLEFPEGAGLTPLMQRLQEPGGLSSCERALARKELIGMVRTGRMLRPAGIRRAKELKAAGVVA